MIEELIAESVRRTSLIESKVLPKMHLSSSDIQATKEYIRLHSDYTAYHLLFALRRKAPEDYKRIPDTSKANILCSALVHLTYLNDWGYLDSGGSHDGEAASALIEIGTSALACLEPILDNRQPAPLFGTEEATMSSIYHYRRCDFAYRYISLIRGLQSSFNPKPKERDKEIKRLKIMLRNTNS